MKTQMFNYFFTPVGPEYKKKFARNVGIAVLILISFYGMMIIISDNSIEPKTKNILTINERIPTRTIVPITITQVTANAQSLDAVTYWGFTILGIEMKTLGDYWGNLPPPYAVRIIVDQNGNDAVDYTRVEGGFVTYKLSLQYYPATCPDGTQIRGEGGYPQPIPIKKGTSAVSFKNTEVGLYPDNNGDYFLEFVSGFETDIEVPADITIVSQETKKCKLDAKGQNFTDVYYTNMQFRFEGQEK